MTEEKKLLITRIELGETEDSKPVVEMYEANPRLKYPSLRLFDLSQLFTIGIDPNDLGLGDQRFVRFRAWYVESDRLNKEGNRYKDVVRLDAIGNPQNDGLQNTLDAIADLLRGIDQRLASIHGLIEVAASAVVQMAGATQEPIGPDNWPGDDEPEVKPEETLGPAEEDPESRQEHELHRPAPKEEHMEKDEGALVLSEDMARRRFGKIAGPALRAGRLDSSIPGRLTSEVSAGALSWRDALQQLEAAIEGGSKV